MNHLAANLPSSLWSVELAIRGLWPIRQAQKGDTAADGMQLAVNPERAFASESSAEPMVFSDLHMRSCLGLLGVGLPISLVFSSLIGYTEWQTSISAYYGTDMRSIFVGFMIAIGVFLFGYRGYDNDNLITNMAGIAAIGVALFPVVYESNVLDALHYLSATVLFVTMVYICTFLFTKSADNNVGLSDDKVKRNRFYQTCGVAIVSCLVIMGLKFGFEALNILPQSWIMHQYTVLIAESIAIVGIGAAWLVKGQALRRV